MTTYHVNDIFYSLQGEGCNAGRAAVFVRFSGCNLRCPFCDTDFAAYDELSAEAIVGRMRQSLPPSLFQAGSEEDLPMVVLTGGEPTLQADEALLSAIHAAGFRFIAMESNGTHLPPRGLDWLTVSPKSAVTVSHCDELKVIFDGHGAVNDHGIEATHRFLQPMDTGDAQRNADILRACTAYIEHHPRWRLSLQIHKLIGIK